MSISVFREFKNPVCDICGHMLGSEKTRAKCEKAMRKDGWIKRDGKDICPLCQRKEKKAT